MRLETHQRPSQPPRRFHEKQAYLRHRGNPAHSTSVHERGPHRQRYGTSGVRHMTHRAHPVSGRDGEVLGIQTPGQKQRGGPGRRDGQHQSRSERVSRLRRPPGWYCPLGQKPSTARRGEMGPPTAPTEAAVADSAAALTIAAVPDSAAALTIAAVPDSAAALTLAAVPDSTAAPAQAPAVASPRL